MVRFDTLTRVLAGFFLLATVFAGAGSPQQASPTFRAVKISNTEPRRDVDGQVIDAHDGCLLFQNGRYYLYGTAYGKSAGFGINNRFRVSARQTWSDGHLRESC